MKVVRSGTLIVGLGIGSILTHSGCAPSIRADTEEAEVAPVADGDPTVAPWRAPVPARGYNAREGRALFLHYCAPCHGEGGHGDGFNAYNLDPPPRDLAAPEFQSGRSDADIAAVVRSGGGAAGLSTGMPPWGRTLSPRQIDNLVRFVRGLEPDEE